MNSKLNYPPINDINSNDKMPEIICININNTSNYVDNILNEETCPNCGATLFDGKCENITYCGYWHADDYMDSLYNHEQALFAEHEKLSKIQKWNWKKHLMSTMNWQEFYFYNFFWRIESDKANIQIEIYNKKIKVNVSYDIVEEDEIKKIWKIHILWKVKKLLNWQWTDTFYNYKELKKLVVVVLSDSRFNKHF